MPPASVPGTRGAVPRVPGAPASAPPPPGTARTDTRPSGPPSPGAPLPRTLLTPLDRLPRTPLADQARQLRARLHTAFADPGMPEDDRHAEAAHFLNRAALMALHIGAHHDAARLCALHQEWACRLAARPGHEGDLLHALQPYLNEGRLLAGSGRTDAALEHFALHLAAARRLPFTLRGRRLTAGTWDRVLARDPACADVLARTYVVDSVKALLRASDFPGVLEFAHRAENTGLPVADPDALAEARLLAWIHLGHHERALALARDAGARATGIGDGASAWRALVFVTYEALSAARDGATDLLEEVAEAAAQPVLDSVPVPARTDLATLVADHLHAAGRTLPARRLARAAHDTAVSGRDEVARHALLVRLTKWSEGGADEGQARDVGDRTQNSDDRARDTNDQSQAPDGHQDRPSRTARTPWPARLAALRARSWYASVRAAPAPGAVTVLPGFYQDVLRDAHALCARGHPSAATTTPRPARAGPR
ncbi:hypothetical protein [Streptomyces sp. NPDC003077]|uniref:hypothetical protein n=1 Tax=Streptomyces sp. NPDC003077 TaxID=3154443 RepID=UPI0033B0764B